jgi:hypothetical protein
MRKFLTSTVLAAGAVAAAAPAALASHDAALSVDRVALGTGGAVMASGSITCPAPRDAGNYDVSVEIRQPAGRTYTTAFPYVTGECTSAGGKKWSTTLLFGSGRFHPGKVIVTATGTSCSYDWEVWDEPDCDSDLVGPVEMRLVKG